MANVIKLKTGTSTPTTSDITNLEVAIDKSAKKLYLNDNGTIKEIGGGGGISDGDKGDITVSSSGATFTIDSGVIDNANIASNAAIAGSKISPDFGSQTVASGQVNVTSTLPKLRLIDSNNNPSYSLRNNNGTFEVYDDLAPATRFSIDDAKIVSKLNHDFDAGIDVTGNITGTTNLTIGTNNSIFAENNLRFNPSGDAFIDHNTTGQDIKFRVSNSSSLDTTPLTLNSDGHVDVAGNLDVGAGIDVTGAITGTGDVTIDTSTFKVDSSNNRVGIGTSSPSDLLDLYNSTNNSRVVRISHPQYPTAAAAFFGWSSDGSGTTNNLFNIGVQYSSSYYNVINIKRSEQKVGINNNNPAESLDVTGNIKASGTIDVVLKDGVTATTQSATDSTTKVATTAFTQSAIGNATISGSQISTNAIDSSKIASGAVTTAKIADSTGITTGVTTAKLANDAVTSQKLANNTISTDKLQNDSVTTPKLNLISTSSVPSLEAKGDGSSQDGYIQLNCSQNSHGVKIKSPPHSANASYTLTLPNDTGSANQVLKTDGSGGLDWVDQTAAYTNASVDAHLNQSNPTSGYVLSWNGSDYAWVAQSGGGGGSGISNVVEDTTPQLGGNLDIQTYNISGTGTITATSVASSANGMRKITASTSSPSGGSDGDIWIKYTA